MSASTDPVGHFGREPFAHVPLWQDSPVVHGLPSSQLVPFDFVGFEHRPVDGLHVPTPWHWSEALQTFGVPRHVPD